MRHGLPFELGRYRLTDRIGAGSMGAVYKGDDPLLGRPVAVKLVHTDLLDETERVGYRMRFRREAQLAGSCIHPGIVTVYDYAEADGDPYIVMEFVEGPSLQKLLEQQGSQPAVAVDLCLQVLAALGHAHARGIVHRDIKPSNIIMGPGSKLKVADFGIAQRSAASSTMAGVLLGTPNYMSPERARGEAADHRADLFAVGMLLYRMVLGTLPYGTAEAAVVLQRIAAPEPIDLAALDAREPRLASVVALALEKDPRRRFQSAEEFAHMLRAVTVDRFDGDLWPSATGPSPARANPGTLMDALPQWPESLLAELRLPLADAIGPMAQFLLQRAARSSADQEELIETLCRQIEPAGLQATFSRKARSILDRHPLQPLADGPSETTPIILTTPVMAAIQSLLARFVGPIAPLLMKRSAVRAQTLGEFGEKLSAQIPRPADREAFRRAFETEVGGDTQTFTVPHPPGTQSAPINPDALDRLASRKNT